MAFVDELLKIIGSDQLKIKEPMSRHTTFRIGGEADYLVSPRLDEVEQVIELCKLNEMPYHIIGNGSNLLVGDKGVRGVVIELGSFMRSSVISNTIIYAQAGAMLSVVAAQAAKNGLTGMEFASGIPGTIGGALAMNAGAYGGEIKDIIRSVVILNPDGSRSVLTPETYEGGYRTSAVMKRQAVVLEVELELKHGNVCEIEAKMEDLKARRLEKQPLEYPSAGSTFKRPEGYFAGKLIMDCGLAGYQVGGAQVSEKHCGFVINRQNATAADVKRLMEDVTAKVKEQYGVKLEPEVRLIGEF